MDANKIKYETTMQTFDFLQSEWAKHPKRKGAYQDIQGYKSRLQMEAETGRIPTLKFKKKTWADYLRETTWGERVAAFLIIAFLPIFFWVHYILTGLPVKF